MFHPFRSIVLFLLLMALPGSAEQALLDTASGAAHALRLTEQAEADRMDRPGASLKGLLSALPLAEKAGDRALMLRILRAKRDLELGAGDLDGALRSGMRVVGLNGTSGDRAAMADDWKALADVHAGNGHYTDAIDAGRRALLLSKTTNDDRTIGNATLHLMDLMLEAGRCAELKHQSDDALACFERAGDELGSARVLMRQGEALVRQGRPADALNILHRAQHALDGKRAGPEHARVLVDIAQANADASDWASARAAIDQAFSGQDGPVRDPDAYALLSRICEAEGHLPQAVAMERRRIALRDSLVSARMAERTAGLQALYSVSATERDMADLQEQNKANEEELVSQRWRMHIVLVASIVLLASATFLFLLWRKLHRAVRRIGHKNTVIGRQADEIRRKNLELERQNLRLAETLMNEEEKDVILKEIHHRVKNDLQIVNALLELQGTYANDERLGAMLGDCQGRVRAMAMVHEHIYKCGDLNRVNVKAHVMALALSVVANHGLEGRVTVDTQITLDRATLGDLTPLSLLLNELLSNSAKHAFQGRTGGRITIVLRRLGESRCELLFSDDGVGLDKQHFFHTDSFGLQLVRTLAAQLSGTIHLLNGEGTAFQLMFTVSGDKPLRRAS